VWLRTPSEDLHHPDLAGAAASRGRLVDPPVDATGHGPGASLAGGLPGVLRPGHRQAPGYLRRRCYGAKRSRLQPIKDFVKLETHWDGIVGRHDSRISNGLLEGTNSLIRAAKARARGYRSKPR